MTTDDIARTAELIKKREGELGVTQADFDTGQQLLQEYGQRRDAAFDAMVGFVGRSDESGIDSDWKDCCSNGKEALSHLNDAMPPEGGEGLVGVGADAFYRGEFKMWDQNAKAEIALAAQEIETMRLIHEELIEDCRITLETIKDGDAVIQEAVRDIFPNIKNELIDLANNTRKLVTQALSSHQFDWMKPVTDQTANVLVDLYKSARDQSRQRAALKKNLIDHYKTVENTNKEIGKWKLDETLKDGAAAADALLENRDSEYEARDWEDFAVRCKEALNKRYDAAEKNYEELYETVEAALKQRIVLDFETLCSDGAQLIAWLNEIDTQYSDLQSLIDDQQEQNSRLLAGPARDGIESVIVILKAMVQASFADYTQMKEDIKKGMDQE